MSGAWSWEFGENSYMTVWARDEKDVGILMGFHGGKLGGRGKEPMNGE